MSATSRSSTRWQESYQASLLRVDGKTEPTKSFRQYLFDLPGVHLIAEDHDKIIGVANEECLASHTRSDDVLKPFVQDFMEIDVRQKGRDHSSLWRAGVWVRKLACFENPSLEPLIDYPSYHTIAHPQVKKAPEMSMVQRIEELPDVHFVDVPASHAHDAAPKRVQRVVT